MDSTPIGMQGKLGADSAAAASFDRLAESASRLPPAEAAKKFEALFATLLVKEMRKALPDGFFGGEAEGDIYAGWFDEHIGEMVAKNGGLHLAEKVQVGLERKVAAQGGSGLVLPGASGAPADRGTEAGGTPALRRGEASESRTEAGTS